MRVAWLAGVLALTAWADKPKRPAVDLSAMREAMGAPAEVGIRYPSAASYAHFLKARLAHHDGDHRQALDELRLALASDDANPYLMTQLAEQFARSGELDKAEGQLRRVVERDPDYQPAHLLLGRVLYEGQKTARARQHLTRAIRLKPSEPDAYLVLTQLWLDQNHVDDAIRTVDELGAALPGEPVGYRRLGLALAERNDPRAEKLLQKAVERDPGDVEAWGSLARIAEASGSLERAQQLWDRALEHDPDNRDVLLNAGRVALRLRDYDGARAYFSEVLAQGRDAETAVKVSFAWLAAHQLPQAVQVLDDARKNGNEPRLHFYAGLVHERLRDFDKASSAFASVPGTVGDGSYEARLHHAICLSQLNRHQAAIAELRALTQEKPSLAGLETSLARALERAGQQNEAETLLRKAMARGVAPDVLEALTGFYARQARLDDAVSLFSAALARMPRDEALTAALASVLEKKGQWRQAVAQMRTLLDADPQNAAALNFIGYTTAQNGGDLDEAESHARRALVVRPDNPAFLDTLGWVLVKRGRCDEASTLLERAVEASPEDPTLYEHLGEASLKAGKKSRAQECFSRALELLTQNPDEAERPGQRADLERRLKLLSAEQQRR